MNTQHSNTVAEQRVSFSASKLVSLALFEPVLFALKNHQCESGFDLVSPKISTSAPTTLAHLPRRSFNGVYVRQECFLQQTRHVSSS